MLIAIVLGAACMASVTAHAAPQSVAAGVRPEEAVPRELSDAVATRLSELGLTGLLVTHLEAQLDLATTDEERAGIVGRLALLLAELVENEEDPARRDQLMERSARIVDRFDAGSDPLRLVLLRSRHRAAQRVAEERRAGRAATEDATLAAEEFRTLARAFEALAKRADTARTVTEREISRSAGMQAEALGERSAQQEQVARSAQFFRAWALYYRAWLMRDLGIEGWRETAFASQTAFAQLIEPGRAAVDPAEVSVDLRRNEGFASAVLGSGLCASLVQTGATADAWLALLEAPGTHEAVRQKLPAWRMASLLDRSEYARALALLMAEGEGSQGTAMALIAAARAAAEPNAPGAGELLTEAVSRIASAGRLADLAAMKGVASAAAAGAGAGLFEGVRLAAEAQRAHSAGEMAAAREAWQASADALDRALGTDAPGAIVVGARALQGWALRGAGRPEAAADAFLASAKGATGERAADTLWNAVLCLDEATRAGSPAAAERAHAIVERVVAEHEGTGAAVRAHAWRVVHAEIPLAADVDALLAPTIPAELAPAARRAAIEGLYRRFRTLKGAERTAAARLALRAADDEIAPPGAEGTLDLRRRLEMSMATEDRARAAEALAALEARAERDAALAVALAEELAARRVQIARIERRTADALAAAQGLDPDTPWGRVGWRAARDAVVRDPASGAEERALTARAVVRGTPESERRSAEVAAWARAEAALRTEVEGASRTAGDPRGAPDAGAARGAAGDARAPAASAAPGSEDARSAAAAVAVALARDPTNADLALAEVEIRLALGERERALEALRKALARLPVGSEQWLAGKALQVRAVAAEDPARARLLLDQARGLAGGWGEGASADALRALDRSVPGGPRP